MTDCAICGEAIQPGDVTAVVRGSCHGQAHVPCTADGVTRWVREDPDREYRTPLLWDRSERPTWRVEPLEQGRFSKRAYTHVDCPAECGDTCDRVTAHPSAGDRLTVGDVTVAYPS